MKRFLICSFVFFLVLFSASGCRKIPPLCRVATQVEITCQHQDLQITRNYTSTEKMQAILLYLRLLQTKGVAETNPAHLQKDIYNIRVQLSDGRQHIYAQTAHRYFKANGGRWMRISPEAAKGLYEIMARYESDRNVSVITSAYIL